MAWCLRWQTTDLVWSLWLSSLTVGYAMIVWDIFGPVLGIIRGTAAGGATAFRGTLVIGATLGGGLFLLAFFTVHFGMFHFVHSVFLNSFFPVIGSKRGPSLALYLAVLGRYWYFVPVAALAERKAFVVSGAGPVQAATAGSPAGVASQVGKGNAIMRPYKNVIRMHLLIFFFAFIHLAKLDGFLVYAVVYAVYFFPWRLLGSRAG